MTCTRISKGHQCPFSHTMPIDGKSSGIVRMLQTAMTTRQFGFPLNAGQCRAWGIGWHHLSSSMQELNDGPKAKLETNNNTSDLTGNTARAMNSAHAARIANETQILNKSTRTPANTDREITANANLYACLRTQFEGGDSTLNLRQQFTDSNFAARKLCLQEMYPVDGAFLGM